MILLPFSGHIEEKQRLLTLLLNEVCYESTQSKNVR
jgi:hypothetical protein